MQLGIGKKTEAIKATDVGIPQKDTISSYFDLIFFFRDIYQVFDQVVLLKE